ncbi:MAG TPA: hypothetical protein VKA50_06145 [Gammaproteobacteria bacterium]|nr:hypothetical protein [Gammaproteobacteria bacterium]
MKWLTYWTVAFALAGAISGAGAAERHFGPTTSVPPRLQKPGLRQGTHPVVNTRLVAERVAKLRRARDILRRQAAAPLPDNLPRGERAEAKRYRAWLKNSAKRMDALARRGESLLRMQSGSQSEATMRRIQETNRSFSMQYLALQQKIQQESREFNLVSNIMKTKHEAAKNAINNIR